MKIAFTAPMKPLDHPVPSGDRTMGRLIVRALESLGHEVRIASRFRSWRKDPVDLNSGLLHREALSEAERIADHWTREGYRPDLFLTYHLYHKAPDWIGPALAERFGLPYAIVEASRAPKRQTGSWAAGFAAADAALKRADAVAAIHSADLDCLRPVVAEDRLQVVLPFLDASPFQAAGLTARSSVHTPFRLLTVGMMREGDKTGSYEVLASALKMLKDRPWHLTLVGDGPCRDHILSLFPRDRITFLGALPPEDLPAQYAAHDLLVWPAIREAFGLVFLEAQAAGTAVLAGATFGVPDIVRHGDTGLLSPEGDVEAFAANLRRILDHPDMAMTMGRAAAAHIGARHTLAAGAARLEALLQRACRNRAAASNSGTQGA